MYCYAVLFFLPGDTWNVYFALNQEPVRSFEAEGGKLLLMGTNPRTRLQCASFLVAACKTHNTIVIKEERFYRFLFYWSVIMATVFTFLHTTQFYSKVVLM